jgi:stress-induced morphogen
MEVEPVHPLSFVISRGIKQGMKAGIIGSAISFPDSRESIHSQPSRAVSINSLWITGSNFGNRSNLHQHQPVNLFVIAALAGYRLFHALSSTTIYK